MKLHWAMQKRLTLFKSKNFAICRYVYLPLGNAYKLPKIVDFPPETKLGTEGLAKGGVNLCYFGVIFNFKRIIYDILPPVFKSI